MTYYIAHGIGTLLTALCQPAWIGGALEEEGYIYMYGDSFHCSPATIITLLAGYQFSSVQFSHSVVSDSLRPHESSMPGLPVHHQPLEFTQTHVQLAIFQYKSSKNKPMSVRKLLKRGTWGETTS